MSAMFEAIRPAPGSASPSKRQPSMDTSQQLTAIFLSAPALLLMAVLLLGPLVLVVGLSFTDYSLGNQELTIIGLDQYREMAGDRIFRLSLSNTLIYVLVVVPGATFLGLGAALLINGLHHGRSLWQTVYFLPVMATLIAMAIVWEFMLNARFGLLSQWLQAFGLPAKNWLQEPATALPVLSIIGIWQLVGFNMVLFLAGLSAIPRELYHALALDGSEHWFEQLRTIVWPLLMPVTTFVLVVSSIRSFQVFDTVHVLTRGGPNNASMVLLYQIYQEGFEFFRSGYAAALTVVFLALVTGITVIRLLVNRFNAGA